MPYMCAKFERNQYTARVFFFGSKLLLLNGAKEKTVKKMGNFQEHISQATGPIFFKFGI